MSYPSTAKLKRLIDQIARYAELKHERGSKGIARIISRTERDLKRIEQEITRLPESASLSRSEPDGLDAIRALRPPGPRRIWTAWNASVYSDKVTGAFIGRCAGCILGAPVEMWPVDRMERLARENGDAFPPVDYWSSVPFPDELRYATSKRSEYTRSHMKGVPVDDDIIYTLLGLLIAETYGLDFTTDDVARAWIAWLPFACTAEEIALNNIRAGISAARAADKNNPYCEWIGADIRSDPWGYIAAGWPEKAAGMAYRDAVLSHRRQGVYGAMYFAAVIAAAFTVADPLDALSIGLTEIPRNCALAKAVRWALRTAPSITSWRDARSAVDRAFPGMHQVHTINNACLTIFGVCLGRYDLTKVIGETVAMGLDNDCTAATAGSITGAVIGATSIPSHWHQPFQNTVHSYLTRHKRFTISGIVQHFTRLSRRLYRENL